MTVFTGARLEARLEPFRLDGSRASGAKEPSSRRRVAAAALALCLAAVLNRRPLPAVEVVSYLLAGVTVRKLGSTACLHLVSASNLLRVACFTFLDSWGTFWAVLPVELSYGFTYGLATTISVEMCEELSLPGLQVTTLAIFQAMYSDIGPGTSSLASSLIYQHYGARWAFGSTALTLAAGWAACLASQAPSAAAAAWGR
ncbi:hypothetical protein WJX81_001561 [Elliptochloris bilobata]|uniref:Major facilitator superfamily associated domain-containing protein n=1 Tax=Elliptochloris bilobata TaxID=381761 RepID=A0AAW1SE38_9CHLO